LDFYKSNNFSVAMPNKGKLYLIPAPLGEGAVHTLPQHVIDILHRLDIFIAERAKTARRFIKETGPVKPFSELTFYEITKHTPAEERQRFLADAEQGKDIGLLSEAGCPGVADPGAIVVQTAHQRGIEVVPLVGPSSILLGLMASGMNGQNFCFHGYLPAKKPELQKELKFLEQRVFKHDQTQIFIETPYRNRGLIEAAINTLSPDMLFCIAADLTLPTEYVRTLTVAQWRKTQVPDLHKRPAIFLVGK
jgi:16S rRNA (cytidine1402-2'-O)-methyltransferase